MASEYELHLQVTEYLKAQYPDIVFRSDMAGVRLPIGLARKMARLQCTRAYPDLFIPEPRGNHHGLYLELKTEPILKRDGTFKSEHIHEQWLMLMYLGHKGYETHFAVGFDEAREIIDRYLGRDGD